MLVYNGTNFNDYLNGNQGSDNLFGRAGNDNILDDNSDDLIVGESVIVTLSRNGNEILFSVWDIEEAGNDFEFVF